MAPLLTGAPTKKRKKIRSPCSRSPHLIKRLKRRNSELPRSPISLLMRLKRRTIESPLSPLISALEYENLLQSEKTLAKYMNRRNSYVKIKEGSTSKIWTQSELATQIILRNECAYQNTFYNKISVWFIVLIQVLLLVCYT